MLAAASLMPIVSAPASICAVAYTIATSALKSIRSRTKVGSSTMSVIILLSPHSSWARASGPSTQPTIDVSPLSSFRQISIDCRRSCMRPSRCGSGIVNSFRRALSSSAAPRPDRARGDPPMRGTEVFEHALVRVVPRVERGEAINVGVMVYSHRYRYLAVQIELDVARLLAIDPAADVDAVRSALSAFERACTEGPLAGRPLGERFRWLTAPRSTIVQPGPVHSGLTSDPAAELTHLFDTLVRTTSQLDT